MSFPGGPNPSLVQPLPPARRANPPTPLVLIHDGGGTVFSYYILDSLKRAVWAIHNPRYWDGQPWEGGMDEMARHYIDLMYEAGLTGRIILGGWSLGGYLSITVARMLADDPDAKISVAGLILIDSPYHFARDRLTFKPTPAKIEGIPEQVQTCFNHCDVMLRHWDLPQWQAPTCGGKSVGVRVASRNFTICPDELLYKNLRGEWDLVPTKTYHHTVKATQPDFLPPGVLIRCVQPMTKPPGAEEPVLIDLFREETLLGWAGRYPDFIKASIDVDAHHYDVFDKNDYDKMGKLTAQINQALEIIDTLYKKMW